MQVTGWLFITTKTDFNVLASGGLQGIERIYHPNIQDFFNRLAIKGLFSKTEILYMNESNIPCFSVFPDNKLWQALFNFDLC